MVKESSVEREIRLEPDWTSEMRRELWNFRDDVHETHPEWKDQVSNEELGGRIDHIAPYLSQPIRVFENGIYSRFIFIDVYRSIFIQWDRISAVYEYLTEQPHQQNDVVQIETFDGWVGVYTFPPNMGKERDRFLNILKEKLGSRWDAVHYAMGTPFLKWQVLIRHDKVLDKRDAYESNKFDELTYEWGKIDLYDISIRSFRVFGFLTVLLIILQFYLSVIVPNTPLDIPASQTMDGIRDVLLPILILICITISISSYLGSPLKEELEIPQGAEIPAHPPDDRQEDED